MQSAAAQSALQVTIRILREGDAFIAHAAELDVSSHGRSPNEAAAHLREALHAFLGAAARMGTLEEILQDAGYVRAPEGWTPPAVITEDRVFVPLPA